MVDAGDTPIADAGAEQQLLGYLIHKPADFHLIKDDIGAADFHDNFHRRIFDTLARAFEEGWTISAVSIVEALGGDAQAVIFEGMTIGQYVASMVAGYDPAEDPVDTARYLVECAERRANDEPTHDEKWGDFASSMGLVMWGDQNTPGEEYEYWIEDLIPVGEGVVLHGETQTGKSFLTFHMAMCGARALPFFGRRILERFGTVWCAYEAGKGLKARMRAYRRHHNLDIEPLPFAALTTPLDLWSDPANVDKLIGEINGIKHTYFRAMNVPLGMVVIDTHNAATPGASEIDSEAAGRIRAQYRRIVAETGGTVVIVGHSNDQGKHRGNQQLTNYIDTIINVTRKTLRADKDIIPARDDDGREVRVMTVKKQREGQDGEKHEFVLQTVEDGTRNKFGKARTSCVVKGANIEAVSEDEGRPQESAPGSIGAKVTKQEALFLTCMLEALDSDGIAPPLELKASNDVQLPGSVARVVDYDIVKRLMGNKMLREEDSSIEGQKRHRQRVKSALKRAREGLQHVGVVNGYGPLNLIWWTGKAVRGIRATQPRSAELFDDRNQPAAGEISEFF